jgi:hypothetical protein
MTQQLKKNTRRKRSYRPPKHLEAELERRVSVSGLSFNAFITEAVFGRNRHRPAENRKLALVLGLGQAIVERLKPFNAVAARDPEIKVLLEDIKLILIEIRSALFLLLGRKP